MRTFALFLVLAIIAVLAGIYLKLGVEKEEKLPEPKQFKMGKYNMQPDYHIELLGNDCILIGDGTTMTHIEVHELKEFIAADNL